MLKKILVGLVFVLMLLLVTACIQVQEEVVTDQKYFCEVDSDCRNSCGEGAVNRVWYNDYFDSPTLCRDKKGKTHAECLWALNLDCADGCAGIVMDQPKCINNLCTAFWRNGKRDDQCNKWIQE